MLFSKLDQIPLGTVTEHSMRHPGTLSLYEPRNLSSLDVWSVLVGFHRWHFQHLCPVLGTRSKYTMKCDFIWVVKNASATMFVLAVSQHAVREPMYLEVKSESGRNEALFQSLWQPLHPHLPCYHGAQR